MTTWLGDLTGVRNTIEKGHPEGESRHGFNPPLKQEREQMVWEKKKMGRQTMRPRKVM